MQANTFTIYTDEELAARGGGAQEQTPFIRISNCGCGAEGCNCSPDRWISISTGKIGITATLTEEEFEALRQAFQTPEVWLSLVEREGVPA